MGRSTMRTKNRIHSQPEKLVVGMSCDESGLLRMCVELGMTFDPMTADDAADSVKAGARLSSWQKLCSRYSASSHPTNTQGAKGAGAALEPDKWLKIQVCWVM